MKSTKFLILSFAVLFAFSLQAQKQAPVTLEQKASPRVEKPTEEQQAAKRMERQAAIATELGLTEEQTVQFNTINDKYRTQMRDLRANNTQEREAMGAQMKTIRAAQKVELEAILTPEQMEKLKTAKQSTRSKRRPAKVRPEGVSPQRKVGGGF